MTEGETAPEPPEVQDAKGAVRTAIGKLIGDDAEVARGRDEQAATDLPAADRRGDPA